MFHPTPLPPPRDGWQEGDSQPVGAGGLGRRPRAHSWTPFPEVGVVAAHMGGGNLGHVRVIAGGNIDAGRVELVVSSGSKRIGLTTKGKGWLSPELLQKRE